MTPAPAASPSGEGLALTHRGHRTRLKWHRLRRRLTEPVFSLEAMRHGFAIGASMELDLRVRADGGFVVLHDADLAGETTGRGRVAEHGPAELRSLRLRDGLRPMVLSEELAAMLDAAHPTALLQFDMKDDLAAIGERGLAHLAEHFAGAAASIIVSGDCLALIARVADRLPGLKRGIDPTDKLVAIHADRGLAAVEAALRADLRGPTAPDTVYLAWELLLEVAREGLDLVALCRAEGKRTDAWTFTLENPDAGFSATERRDVAALMALKPDQITTDAALAIEAAWLAQYADTPAG